MVNVVPSQDNPKTDWTCLHEITGSPPHPPSHQAPTTPDQFEDQGEGWQDNRWNVWIIFLAQLFFWRLLGGTWVFYFVARYVRILFLSWFFLAFWTGLISAAIVLHRLNASMIKQKKRRDLFRCWIRSNSVSLLSVTLENEADKNIEDCPFPYPQKTFLSYKVRCGTDIWACSWA